MNFAWKEKQCFAQKIKGLHIKYDVMEYRGGNAIGTSTTKMPLGKTVSDITLIRGMFAHDSMLWNWFDMVRFNTIKREQVVIKLLDEKNEVIFKWTLRNAFPKEIAFGELDAMAKSIAIEELVVACEDISFSLGG